MNLNYIKAFYHVAKLGSISKASRYLNVSQPTITKKIRMLEESVGFPLINRGARGVKLTADGRRIYNHSQKLIDELDCIEKIIHGPRTDSVRIVTTNSIGSYLLPKILSSMNLTTDFPVEVSSSVHYQQPDHIEADVYIGPYMEGIEKDFQVTHFFDFDFNFYASEKYLKNRRLPKTLNDLKGHDMVGFSDERRATFEETKLSFILTDPAFQRPIIKTSSAFAEVDLANRGVGIALLSDIAVKHFKPKIRKLYLSDFDGVQTPAYFFIRKETGRDKALFIKKLYNLFLNDLKQITLQDVPA